MEAALGRLLDPNAFLEWSSHYWPDSPQQAGAQQYAIKWSSSTAPPVVSPIVSPIVWPIVSPSREQLAGVEVRLVEARRAGAPAHHVLGERTGCAAYFRKWKIN